MSTSLTNSVTPFSELPTATYSPTFPVGSETSSSATATFTGDDTYPVFPNGRYLSRFAYSPSDDAGLTQLDIDLYNYCYLPSRFLKRDTTTTSRTSTSPTPKPTYQNGEPPCKRQSACNTNCVFQNTNNTFSGLEPYSNPQSNTSLSDQQNCYCNIYPFWDSALGCQECFRQHGGIEGYHWFPAEYVQAVSSSYCGSKPVTTDFYAFVSRFEETQTAVSIGSTTASNVLGTQTGQSGYYTYSVAAAAASTTASSKSAGVRFRSGMWKALFIVGALCVALR